MEGAIAGEAPACACGARDWAPLAEDNGYRWWRCAACGLARLIPMPAGSRAAIADDAVGRGYIDYYRPKLDKKLRRSLRRVRRLAKLMPGERLLDVGSNVGCLVEAGRRIGLDSVGVEMNRTLVDFARETYPACRFLAAALEEAPLEGAVFDGVSCCDVIEHVPDQERFVAALVARMAPGAVLYLTTPAAQDLVHEGQAPSGGLGAPGRKLLHTRQSLAALLARHGLARVRFLYSHGRGLKLYARKAAA